MQGEWNDDTYTRVKGTQGVSGEGVQRVSLQQLGVVLLVW